MLRTAREYLEGVSRREPRVYLGGKRVNSLIDHPVTRTVVEATAKVFELTLDPRYQEVMTATSHLSGERVSRNLHINRSTADLERRTEMAVLTSQKLGTCNYRCVGCDALNGLASITWQMDRDLGTEYHQRLTDYLRFLQKGDLAFSGGMTDTKGDRSKRPAEQDPDSYVHIVERRPDGIVVRGAKQHQSGSYAADETLVLPGLACTKGEEDYAVAFAVANPTPGVIFISQYTPFSAERELEKDARYLGNPVFGQRETSLMIFEDVFIPRERVFMCGEVKYTRHLITRFAKMHRMNCGGACKVGFADLIIGAARLAAEYTGIAAAPHVVEKLTEIDRKSVV